MLLIPSAPQDKDIKAIRDEFRTYCKEKGLPSNYGWKIFEWTGTGEGQAIALELLSFVGILVIAGYGMQKNEYHDVPFDGIRCRYSRYLGLPTQVLP